MAVNEGGGREGKMGRQAQVCAVVGRGSGRESKVSEGMHADKNVCTEWWVRTVGEMVRWARAGGRASTRSCGGG